MEGAARNPGASLASLSPAPATPPTDRLTEALIAVIHAGLTEKQRKDVAELVGVTQR